VAVDELGEYVAVAYDDDSVVVYKGDVMKDKFVACAFDAVWKSCLPYRASKPISVRSAATASGEQTKSTSPISTLALCTVPPGGSDAGGVVLFVGGAHSLVSYVLRDRQVIKTNVHSTRVSRARACATLMRQQPSAGGGRLELSQAGAKHSFVVATRDVGVD